MIAWINFAILIFATLFLLYFYFLSVGPAALERVIGLDAYRRCTQYRVIAMVFEFVTVACYIVYDYYPLSTPLPSSFSWPWWVSGLIAAVIGIPSLLLMGIGLKDAGEEAMAPKKEHTMYGGIYTRLRHPQATGEVFVWLWIAFLLHSPVLVIFSFVYFMLYDPQSKHQFQVGFKIANRVIAPFYKRYLLPLLGNRKAGAAIDN